MIPHLPFRPHVPVRPLPGLGGHGPVRPFHGLGGHGPVRPFHGLGGHGPVRLPFDGQRRPLRFGLGTVARHGSATRGPGV